MSTHTLSCEASLSDYRWLITGEGRAWLERCQADPLPQPQQARRLRRQLTRSQTHVLLEQLELRERAAVRFQHAPRMFFSRRSLEQATDERLATYKATRFPENAPITDLCCGIGGDLLALAARGPTLGVEHDPVAALLAAANLQMLAAARAWVAVGDVRSQCVLPDVAIHLDPDRRPGDQRSVTIAFHEPGPELIEQLIRHPAGMALKLSPATDATDLRLHGAELEWIGHRRQCQQLVAWYGPLARAPDERVATILTSDGAAQRLAAALIPRLPMTSTIGRYVVEPVPCVLAAGLAAVVAAQQGLMSLTAGGGYLTGDRVAPGPWTSDFEVVEVMPYRPKRIKAWLAQRNIGRLEIKLRGVEVDPGRLLQQLRLPGSAAATLILLRQGQKVVAVATRRLPSVSDSENPGGGD